VRISLFLLIIFSLLTPAPGQVPDDSDQQAPRALPAAPETEPAMAQDAEAAREKLLKAADQIDMIQSNAETTKVDVDAMKNDIAQLQAANTDLKQQLVELRAALDKAEAERAKERQVLVDEVAQLVASRGGSVPKRHQEIADETGPDIHAPDGDAAAGESAPVTEIHQDADTSLAPPPDPPKPQKGYYHVVESGETLTMICAAYREQGVKVSVGQVRRANGLTANSVLKVGQKLFIPKPGT
jgi:LysM repeat protein